MKGAETLGWICRGNRGGLREILGGLVTYDPQWRERGILAAFEASLVNRKLTPAQLAAKRAVDTAIEFICGKPGGGKSMYATKLILDELISGQRPIVTNLALNLARLQEYLDELGAKVHVIDRVRLLEKEEITEFYLRRGVDLVLDLPSPGQRFMDWTPSQNDPRTAGGVMYVIDECHNYLHPMAFGATKLTPEHPLMQYATQHRKLKDTCYLVTQSVENVHVQIRRLGQQFTYVRNERKETFRGFRRGEGFRTTVYLTPPTSDATVPIDGNSFRLDVRGLASCYYTAGGVGIAAAGVGDGGSKKKGMNLKWIWIFGAAALVAVAVFLWYGSEFATDRLVGRTVGRQAGKVVKSIPHTARGKSGAGVAAENPTTATVYYDGLIVDHGRIRVAVHGEWLFVVARTDVGGLVLEDGQQVFDRHTGQSPQRQKATTGTDHSGLITNLVHDPNFPLGVAAR